MSDDRDLGQSLAPPIAVIRGATSWIPYAGFHIRSAAADLAPLRDLTTGPGPQPLLGMAPPITGRLLMQTLYYLVDLYFRRAIR